MRKDHPSPAAARVISRAARRVSKRAARRGEPLGESEIAAMSVPTAPTWKRVLLAVAGLLLIGVTVLLVAFDADRNWVTGSLAIMVGFCGGLLVAVGWWGSRKSVDAASQQLAESVGDTILRAIIDAAISV